MVSQQFLSEISLLIDNDIRIYSIENSIIEILFYEKIIDRSVYYFLKFSKENVKNLYIKNILKNKDYNFIINNKIKYLNNKFIYKNNIKEENIIEIFDSNIILKNCVIKDTNIDLFKYELKDQYSNFININSIRIYSLTNLLGTKLKVIGLEEENIKKHYNFMIKFISNAINILNSNGAMPSIQYIKDFYNRYINRMLPVEFYRGFNQSSSYVISFKNSKYEIFDFPTDGIKSLDISFNKYIIQQVFSLVVRLSFKIL